MYKSIKVHLGQGQDLIISIKIYLKYKYTYDNARFCIDDFKILKILTIEIFHDFSPTNVTGITPPPPPNVHMTFLVDKIDMCLFPKSMRPQFIIVTQ